MIQQYKININPNFTGDCDGPTEPVTGTVEVCPDNPVIRIDCNTELDQCVDNYVEVTIEEQCSCQEGLPFCGGENNTFEVDVDLTCGCTQFTCTDYVGEYTYCSGGQMFDDGCGGDIDCGTDCTGQDICIEGNCALHIKNDLNYVSINFGDKKKCIKISKEKNELIKEYFKNYDCI